MEENRILRASCVVSASSSPITIDAGWRSVGIGCVGKVLREGCRNSDLSPFICVGFVFVSLCYLMLRWLLQLVALRVRSHEWKELEIVVLRHELAILRRQTQRPPITAVPRQYLVQAQIS